MKSLLDEWNTLIKSKYPVIAILFPLLALIGYTFLLPSSQINKAPVVIVDQDNTAYSRQLVQEINASQYINVASVRSRMDHAESLFYHEKYLAVISIPKGLEDNHNRAISSRIGLILDNTNSQSVAFIRTALQEIVTAENMQLSIPALSRTGLNPDQTQGTLNNLAIEARSLFNPTSAYQNTTVLAFIFMLSFMMLNLNSLPMIARLRVSGRLASELHNPFNILFRIVPYVFFCSAGLIFSMGLLKWIDHGRFVADPVLFMIPIILFVIGSVCINLLVAWGAAHPGIAAGRMIFTFMPAFVMSGATLSRALFPPLAMEISDFFPFVWLFKFVRSMGLRGASFREMLPELGSMMLYTGVLTMLVVARALWEKQKNAKKAALAAASPTAAASMASSAAAVTGSVQKSSSV